MKTLLILRHAKSDRSDQGCDDHDRPLNKRGKRDAPRMGHLLRDEKLLPDRIISSSAKRARRTARLVAEACGFTGPRDETTRLYLAAPAAYRQALGDISGPDPIVLVVGHNPGLEMLLEELTGAYESLPTAALVHLRLPIESWCDLTAETTGELVHIWRPRELP